MQNKSPYGLLLATAAMTASLVGLFADWDRIRWIAPFGDPDLTAYIFVPLFIAACYGIIRWLTSALTPQRVALTLAAVTALSLCVLTVTVLCVLTVIVMPIADTSKLIASTLIVAFFASLVLLRASYAGGTGDH